MDEHFHIFGIRQTEYEASSDMRVWVEGSFDEEKRALGRKCDSYVLESFVIGFAGDECVHVLHVSDADAYIECWEQLKSEFQGASCHKVSEKMVTIHVYT